MFGHGPSHGIRALFPVVFDRVVDVLRGYKYASNIYFTVLDVKPRVAVFIGERYSLMVEGFMTAITLVIERGDSTEVRIVTQSNNPYGSRGGDLGMSRSYAVDILDSLTSGLHVSPSGVVNVDYMDSSKSHLLG
jgi:hypothetical protein